MRLALAATLLVSAACDMKLNRGPHLPPAPGEDQSRVHGGIEIAAKDPPKLALPLPPAPVQYTEDRYPASPDPRVEPIRSGNSREDSVERAIALAAGSSGTDDSRIPPEVSRLGPEAVAAYEDLLPPAKTNDAKGLYLRGYQLKGESPEEAIVLFKQVVAHSPPTSEWNKKAREQIASLKRADKEPPDSADTVPPQEIQKLGNKAVAEYRDLLFHIRRARDAGMPFFRATSSAGETMDYATDESAAKWIVTHPSGRNSLQTTRDETEDLARAQEAVETDPRTASHFFWQVAAFTPYDAPQHITADRYLRTLPAVR
jgi:hypothetical protein